MKIPEKSIQKLRSRGLFVSEPTWSDHIYPDGVRVGKPENVEGNFIPDYSSSLVLDIETGEEVRFNAPMVWLFGNHDLWFVLGEEYCPGPGPGDFFDEWSTPDQAVADILDFYFGDATRMQTKAQARKKPVRMSQTESDPSP
ncbi:MAG TPA: hypothetical protein V6C86_00095 [Oculatellaceae cyanobacterium]